MPFKMAEVLYNLAGALALTRVDARIIGLGDAQYRKNLNWVLDQSWLDAQPAPCSPPHGTGLARRRP